ncbi:MAG: ribonuclease J [Firmicutes bacterium]|jgi:ribonuclease J|nr:ribonuclease J [Bacillota bacterium]
MRSRDSNTVSVVALGGFGEIGKNMMALRYRKDIIVVDCGLAFPEEQMLGVDIVIPDITYLLENRDMVRAIVLTHGHEDHVGALPYVLRQLKTPVCGTRLTLGLVKRKLREHGLDDVELREIRPRQQVVIGPFKVESFRVNHSIADCVGLAIHTPSGTIVHSGDFKFDQTPVDGEVADFRRLAELGDGGVLALLSDSTNADRPGYTPSERMVGKSLRELFASERSRILVASFASHVLRIQQVISAAAEFGRKVTVVGRSMENVVEVALELGYLDVPENTLVDIEEASRMPPEKVAILTTGSQGEPMSALARMSTADHKKIDIVPGDVVVIAASPVPGNETYVTRTIDNLFRRGARVIYEASAGVHVSGHASQEELKLMLNLVRPRYFVPIHGEYRHLVHHAELAEHVGIPRERILIGENGSVFEFCRERARFGERVASGNIMVDGLSVGDVGSVVLRDRKQLAEDGILMVVVAVDKQTLEILAGPDVVSRGFVYIRESEELMEDARRTAKAAVGACIESGTRDWAAIKSAVRGSLSAFFHERVGRSPVILPVIMEV